MARRNKNNRSNQARVGRVRVPVPPGVIPQDVAMAPGQQARISRALNRGLHDRNGNLAVNNGLFRNIGRISWVEMIVGKRISQAMPYCREPRFRGDCGCDVVPLEEIEMTPELAARRRELLDLVLHGSKKRERKADGCPGYWSGNEREQSDPLPVTVAKVLRDSLTMDSAGVRIELGTDPVRYPVAWFKAEDGARIRKADPLIFTDNYRPDLKFVEWVILDSNETDKWNLAWNEFAAFIRNPSTSEESQGLGNPELASALEVITGLVTAYKYNVGNFTEWKLPMGFMEIADCDENVLDEFIEDLEMQVGGAAGHWSAVPYISKPPGFEGKEFVRWVDLQQRPTDIQFRDFMMLSFNKLCGLFKISAEELGFPSFDSGKATLQEDSPAAVLENSRDTGFVPLMEQLATFLTDAVVGKFDGGMWKFVFVGLGETDEKTANEARQSRLNMGLTSIEQEQEESDNIVGQVPLDTSLWAKTKGALLKEKPDLLDDRRLLHRFTLRLYIAQGGLFYTGTEFGLSVQQQQGYFQEIMRNQQAEEAKQQREHVDPWAAFGMEHPNAGIQQRIAGGQQGQEDQPLGEEDQGGQEEMQKALPAAAPRVIEVVVGHYAGGTARNVAS